MCGAVSPPCYLPGPNYGGGSEDNGDPLAKVLCTYCYTQCPQPCSRPPPTHASTGDSWTLTGQVWVSLLWGHCSFFLGPGAHNILFVPSNGLFLQSCVSSGSCMTRLMANSSKRAYATPRPTAPRAPAPAAVHCWPTPLQETIKQNSGSVSVGSLGPGVHRVCLSTLSVSGHLDLLLV